MAYLAQPIIVGSSNVVVIEDAHTSTMNLAGNIVRSSHYIPDPSSSPLSTDPHSLHPTLKSLPYPLTLPPVSTSNNYGNNNINTANTNFPRATTFTAFNGASGANFEEFDDEEEDADTEDSRSLMSAVTAESITDNNSIFPGTSYNPSTSYNSYHAIPVGSFRENSMPARGGPAANVRSQSLSRSPIAYHRIPVGHVRGTSSYPIIPTVPSAAVVVSGGSQYGGMPSGSVAGAIQNNGSPVDRVPGSRVVQDASTTRDSTRGDVVTAGGGQSSEECNVCHLDVSTSSPTSPQSPQSPISPSRSPTTASIATITSTCSSSHAYHIACFQTTLLGPSIARTELPTCPAPCGEHIPARCFLHAVTPQMKKGYLECEMGIMMGMDLED